MSVKTRMTLEEFLALPETEPASEFVCGEIVQKAMPTAAHGLIQMALGALLLTFLRGAKTAGLVMSELRHFDRPEDRAYIPDISVFVGRRGAIGKEQLFHGAVESIPDLAVEILSPGDRPGTVADKLAFYLRTGVPLVWIVDPETRRIDAHRPGVPSVSYEAPDVMGGEPVLPGLALDLGELFAVLDEIED
ncbi:MAG: Uma2 family endonuclease [Tepidiformaceae bacterium]